MQAKLRDILCANLCATKCEGGLGSVSPQGCQWLSHAQVILLVKAHLLAGCVVCDYILVEEREV